MNSPLKRMAMATIGAGLSFTFVILISPLPRWILDSLVMCQWLLSVHLLIYVWLKPRVDHLEDLPKWLIGFTVTRLCINVVTTRSILSHATGGGVIDRAGDLMMGDRWLVGLVFFFGLLSVQYVVIAKGLERIAQLTARFTLESIPGAQQAISLERDQGHLHPEIARHLREELADQSRRASAIEGVLKFVKGEQIASFLLVTINGVGGASVGIFHEALTHEEAIGLYGKLAIGDGLLAQLPALYSSLATTLYITYLLSSAQSRSTLKRRDEREDQSDRSTLFFTLSSASIGLLLISLLPLWERGSQWVMITLSLSSVIGLYFYNSLPSFSSWWTVKANDQHGVSLQGERLSDLLVDDSSLVIEVSPRLIDLLGGERELLNELQHRRQRLGLPARQCRIISSLRALESREVTLYISGQQVASERLIAGMTWSPYDHQPHQGPLHPITGIEGTWREVKSLPPTLAELSQREWITQWILLHWRSSVSYSWMVTEVWAWLRSGSPTLKAEALNSDLSVVRITDIFRKLSAEGCALTDVDRFLESLARAYCQRAEDGQRIAGDLPTQSLIEGIRLGLGLTALLGGEVSHHIAVIYVELEPTTNDRSLSHRDQGFVLKERLREACRLISQTEEQWRYYEGTLAIMIEGPYRMALRDTISVSRPGFRVHQPTRGTLLM